MVRDMELVGIWSYPNTIRFGAGRIAELPLACRLAGIERPLLVTDRGLAEMPITLAALDLLDAAGYPPAMFSEVDPNPSDRNVEMGLKALREGGFDGIVAFGGGSALDLGKVVAFMSATGRCGISRTWATGGPRRSGRHSPGSGGADHRRHRVRSGARRNRHRQHES